MLRNRNRSGIAVGEPSQRQRRVAEEIRHRLAEILIRTEFRDPALVGAQITVAEVRMSPDLKHATVFASVLGGGDITPMLPALKRAGPFLRGEIGRGLRLRVTPDLHFQPDAALDEATRINKLLAAPQVRRDLDP
ncbi:MAG TPA: 30S ribosome-binding factor RbfA [Acidiphilium sp.]|nr:MAG: ribosome-binding factor A [Acidiphilium sp. 21-60-14]OYV91395.1 MAG: ribosome-binding factor A [Acidiphilium sp. 37-60-79]OZB41389.1 MAG: ribosome-binding factor A [Acidiphilium sp. 34-60-192]HQT87273.1 30S ribosome-binding factor RbfA [Acidiphilium sp.]HQU23200.1 30S ribosome-binding factor RbfA [Acidiphilium sp.]